jgi:hypothetical protein
MPSRANAASKTVTRSPSPRSERKLRRATPDVPTRIADAIERAREALHLLQSLQRRTKWHPTWSQILARDYQQARAMLSKAEAAYEAYRRGLDWVDANQMVADYEKFSVFVNDLYERGDWREREHRPRRAGR